jgi:hypothetical protein
VRFSLEACLPSELGPRLRPLHRLVEDEAIELGGARAHLGICVGDDG